MSVHTNRLKNWIMYLKVKYLPHEEDNEYKKLKSQITNCFVQI